MGDDHHEHGGQQRQEDLPRVEHQRVPHRAVVHQHDLTRQLAALERLLEAFDERGQIGASLRQGTSTDRSGGAFFFVSFSGAVFVVIGPPLHPGHLAAEPLLQSRAGLEAQVTRRGRAVGMRVTSITGQRRTIAHVNRATRGALQDRENAVDRDAGPAAQVVDGAGRQLA
jgi:hypothetical protein